jgi:hypothetical protein
MNAASDCRVARYARQLLQLLSARNQRVAIAEKRLEKLVRRAARSQQGSDKHVRVHDQSHRILPDRIAVDR